MKVKMRQINKILEYLKSRNFLFFLFKLSLSTIGLMILILSTTSYSPYHSNSSILTTFFSLLAIYLLYKIPLKNKFFQFMIKKHKILYYIELSYLLMLFFNFFVIFSIMTQHHNLQDLNWEKFVCFLIIEFSLYKCSVKKLKPKIVENISLGFGILNLIFIAILFHKYILNEFTISINFFLKECIFIVMCIYFFYIPFFKEVDYEHNFKK
jgi:hypothetical protein